MVLISNKFEGTNPPRKENWFANLSGQTVREFFKPWKWAMGLGLAYGVFATYCSKSLLEKSSTATNSPAISQPAYTNDDFIPASAIFSGRSEITVPAAELGKYILNSSSNNPSTGLVKKAEE